MLTKHVNKLTGVEHVLGSFSHKLPDIRVNCHTIYILHIYWYLFWLIIALVHIPAYNCTCTEPPVWREEKKRKNS